VSAVEFAPQATPSPADGTFPDGFMWGASTAAYQIEGAATEDGRGPSIWDTFSHTPGRVDGGDSGDVAVDHYHRYRDDIVLMSRLGLTAYRFSVSWPRVQPSGSGRANERGLDFYRRLVDALLADGIEPWLTLYHWDLPQALEDAGGWPSRDTAHRFADYAMLVHEAVGDRVRYWSTLNEPWCSAFLGYAAGAHAPGRREPAASVQAAHHLLLGHGLAVEALRSARASAQIGVTLNLYAVSPASDAEADVDAARRVDGLQNRLFLDAVLRGRYPVDVLTDLSSVSDMAHVHSGDMARIGTPLDLLGINYYSRHTVSAGQPMPGSVPAGAAGAEASPWPGSAHVTMVRRGLPVTSMDWEIDGAGLTEVLRRVATEYPAIPLYVTENGAAFDDTVSADGRVHDRDRVAYLDAHLRACLAAIRSGVPLRGYFAWSLMDNFEWAWGYSKRFGLVYVDYARQQRILKDSAHWYTDVIRHNGVTVPDPAA
jgi:beta-glucosidase